MKLLRYGPVGHERPGILDEEGNIRDLSGLIPDVHSSLLSPDRLDAMRAIEARRLPVVSGDMRLGAPWVGLGKFIAVGLNYHAHALETGNPVPDQPVLFAKWTSCISGPNDDIVYPGVECRLDWEVELGVIIGTRARAVPQARALEYVAGYCLANDLTDRYHQRNGGAGQWGKGKGHDGFGPIGPYLVTADEVPDPQNLHLWLEVNGERVQDSSTSDMIFSCAELVSHCSHFMTLEPGDLIITGTPPGVGAAMKPPRFLKPGDVVKAGSSQLGMQVQRVA